MNTLSARIISGPGPRARNLLRLNAIETGKDCKLNPGDHQTETPSLLHGATYLPKAHVYEGSRQQHVPLGVIRN